MTDSGTRELAPLAASGRIDAMDVLRGIAVVGILFMNVEWFGRSVADLGSFDRELSGLDHAAGWLVRLFVEGKFYKLFALLFGMGFAVMLIRAREAGRPFRAWFVRRMVVLFVIGMLHSIFLWPGDILHDYAFAGLVMLGLVLLFRIERLQKYDTPRTFLRIALVWVTVPFAAAAIAALIVGVAFDDGAFRTSWLEERQVAALVTERMELPVEQEAEEDADEDRELTPEEEIERTADEIVEERREHDKKVRTEVDAYTQPSYLVATRFRLDDTLSRMLMTPLFTMVVLMPLFLLGYWFIASGVLRQHRENRHIFKSMAWLGMILGLLVSLGGLIVIQHPATEETPVLLATGSTLFFMAQYLLAAGYMGVIVLLLGSPRWHARLGVFAPLGRMALTNYVMQSAILAAIFHGYAGGLWGRVSRAPQMILVLAIAVLQGLISAWWLKRYRFGPLEWLWRSATYKSVQPMKVADAAGHEG